MPNNLIRGVRNSVVRSNEAGRRVVEKAESYVGVVENPVNSNTGVDIDRWNDYFGLNAVPWAGSFVTAMYVESLVYDQMIGHSDLETMYANALELGRIFPIPTPGCYVMYATFDVAGNLVEARHVDIFIRWHNLEEYQAVVCGRGPVAGGGNRGVVLSVRNMMLPDIADETLMTKFLVPTSVSLLEAKKVG